MTQSFTWTWRKAVLKSDLPGEARHLLLTLSCYMDENGGNCWPSVKALAESMGKGVTTVKKYLSVAQSGGWVKITQTGIGSNASDYQAAIPPANRGGM